MGVLYYLSAIRAHTTPEMEEDAPEGTEAHGDDQHECCLKLIKKNKTKQSNKTNTLKMNLTHTGNDLRILLWI